MVVTNIHKYISVIKRGVGYVEKNLHNVINALQGDIAVISDYLTDPESFLSKYNLDAREKQALIDKDVDALVTLGLDDEFAANAMSSPWRHSMLCTVRP